MGRSSEGGRSIDGQPRAGVVEVFGSAVKLSRAGRRMELSELLPGLAEAGPMRSRSSLDALGREPNTAGAYAVNNGRVTEGRPTVGPWLPMDSGARTQELPLTWAAQSGGRPRLSG